VSLWQINFIFTYNVRILGLSYNANKSKKELANCLKRVKTNVVLIAFNGVLYEVRAYSVTVSYRRSTGIRCQKTLLGP